MANEEPHAKKRDRISDAGWLEGILGRRPVAVAIFAAAVVTVVGLEWRGHHTLQVAGVGHAEAVDHVVGVATRVAQVHVRLGQLVQPGDRLVTLDRAPIDRALRELDAEIRKTVREGRLEGLRVTEDARTRAQRVRLQLSEATRASRLAQAALARHEQVLSGTRAVTGRTVEQAEARLVSGEARAEAELALGAAEAEARETRDLVQAELLFASTLRRELAVDGDATELERATIEVYESELELLRIRRERLEVDLASLTVTATDGGRVAVVARRGAAVDAGSVLSRVVPDRADEVVAYLPPDTHPGALERALDVRVALNGTVACAGKLALRHGAEVAVLPPGVSPMQGGAGLPVHITLPTACRVGVGQRVSVWLSGI